MARADEARGARTCGMHSERAPEHFDVVIGGGGLAGQALARQLRRELPEARVAVIERQARPLPAAAHKVGESSVELSSNYFSVVLGLDAYLRTHHYLKNGLRFYPGGGRTLALEQRTEIGPPELAKVPSFQLDRGRLEGDLRAMNVADGVTLLEGHSVKDVTLASDGADDHLVHIEAHDGTTRTLRAGWFVDATGRRALLKTKLGLKTPSGHLANAAWWRVKGRVDVADLVPASEAWWHNRDREHNRWYSTVHFMGTGYWLWYIPLAPGPGGEAHTSIGIVVHDEFHPFDTIRSFERSLAWVAKHEPLCHAQIKDLPAEDFLCLKHYSHGSKRCFSADRWSLIGDAGVFADPFYSPGSDFIAVANSFTTELLKARLRGGDTTEMAEMADRFDRFYRKMFAATIEIYRDSGPVLGNPRVMAAKVYWDDFTYWSFLCQYFFRRIYKLPAAEHGRFEALADQFGALQRRAQLLLSQWARRAVPGEADLPRPVHVKVPTIPSILANLHLDLAREMSPDEVHAFMQEKLAWTEEVLDELVLRALAALGPAQGADLAAAVGLAEWPRRPSPERLAAQVAEGGQRRRSLSPIARDMDRSLGRMELHPQATPLPGLVELAFSAPARAVASPTPAI
ncbi:tryptophan 7-halogenase [Nannocystis sp.]|uniref:NAD(P)/FAD-dependent oxidoreductase n=1 Tax=Nannocystis sp. TaxID=1962667 RepID=UPI0025EE4890|nr:tryptophan 7-halogenase [Nannocystis sp.]